MAVIIITMLLLCSCARPVERKDDSPPPADVIIPQEPVNLPPPPTEYIPRRAPAPPPMPDPEITLPSEPAYVISAHPCYEGDPTRKLTLVKIVKREKMGWFRKSRHFVYDCHGTIFCDKESILNFVSHSAYEEKMSCLEHAQEQTIFSICKDSASVRHSTYKGDLIGVMAVINGNSTTLYCDSSLSL